ncbi:MAG: Sec-dependent nitrous-oxide reductase [Gemmatimonadota bacterium]|nr:MAG: Sec-dependent nitrous-oxide reductase [Gemmatimonadota bacterium]
MRKKGMIWGLVSFAVVALAIVGPQSCTRGPAGASVGDLARERGLSEADITAALKTYVPTGQLDEYVMFSSGGHSGQVLVIGLPSMRLLKVIAAFTPEPWQGFGYGASGTMETIEGGLVNGREVLWGDTHHPAISETDGEYDGEWLFIDDKANARVALISLKDFETKQILHNPLMGSDHGATFVTPNTEYVIQSSQYAVPLDGSYADLSEYRERYRGAVTFWKFDRAAGRIDPSRSFSLELPPYWQDLADAGKGPSMGWAFLGSFNTEMATGGIESTGVPFEAGASANDMDYLHAINWQRAAQIFQSGDGVRQVQGMSVIPLDVSVREGLLYLVPEPKSPHGADVTPDGRFIVTAGKLDPHVSVYSFERIQAAIANETFSGRDPYDVPVLDFDAVLEAQVELGLGPLHTQFDGRGGAYTSLFIETAVAKWSLEDFTLKEKIGVHYNIGHLAAAEGDTRSPDGNYLVALNKWSIDRFMPVGPLHPQNFQLIDVTGESMQLLYDMPIGIGEPHYAQIIKADKLDPWLVYPEVGFDPHNMASHPNAVTSGEEKVERSGNTVNVYMTAIRSHFTPEHIKVRRGDRVRIYLTSLETIRDGTHGFAIDKYNINVSLEPGESEVIEFVADQAGVYPFYCSEFCSALHLEMVGYLLVEP